MGTLMPRGDLGQKRKAGGWFRPCLHLPRPCPGSSHARSHSVPGKEGLVSHFPGQKTEAQEGEATTQSSQSWWWGSWV